MKTLKYSDIRHLYLPPPSSHKGQNGRLLIIGGSHLFHAASLWALKVASRIVDLVHYSSVEENNLLVKELKKEFRDGIVVPRSEIESYIKEDDAVLIGPGMVRVKDQNINNHKSNADNFKNLADILKLEDEGKQTATLTNYLLKKYPDKQWVIDAGAMQMMDINLIPKNAVLTPHRKEFEWLWEKAFNHQSSIIRAEAKLEERVKLLATKYQCIVLVKGQVDIACNGSKSGGRLCAKDDCVEIRGGNAGMTKGGTGDVLAGLIAALACKNNPFLSTVAGAFINKQAGDALYQKVGPFFNASDLADEIPVIMKKLFVV